MKGFSKFASNLGLVFCFLLPSGISLSTPAFAGQEQQQGTSSAPPSAGKPSSGSSSIVVAPSTSSTTNSNVSTNGATLFNAQQNVWNNSGNRADFSDTGCALPTTKLDIAANYGNTSSDWMNVNGFNAAIGVSIPFNGQFTALCEEASKIRIGLLKTKQTAEAGKWEAQALITCYEVRKLALNSQVKVIILPNFCPKDLATMPQVVALPVKVEAPPVNTTPMLPPLQPAPKPVKKEVKGGY